MNQLEREQLKTARKMLVDAHWEYDKKLDKMDRVLSDLIKSKEK